MIRKVIVSTLLVFSSVILAGCSTAPAPGPTKAPQEPVSGNQREYEYNVSVARCLTDKGWDVEVDGTGGWGIVFNTPEEQKDLAQADYQVCVAALGDDIFEVSEENAKFAYDNNIRVVECLKREGYEVNEPPAKAEFVRKYLEGSTITWSPYELISPDDEGDAVIACPQ